MSFLVELSPILAFESDLVMDSQPGDVLHVFVAYVYIYIIWWFSQDQTLHRHGSGRDLVLPSCSWWRHLQWWKWQRPSCGPPGQTSGEIFDGFKMDLRWI